MAQSKRKPKKIKKYRKPLNLNIGMIIFGAIFIYVLICVVTYFRTSHYKGYEVVEGSLSTNTIYRGIALRDELVVNADAAGYINYYAREGERVSIGDLVYTVDETGRLNEYLESGSMGENSLSAKELSQFKSEIINFMHGFEPINFDPVYDFKFSLKGTVLKLANANLLENIDSINGGEGLTNMVDFCRSPDTGVVAYWTDQYESLTPDLVTAEIFDETKYEKKQLVGNELVAVGEPAFKLSREEDWSLIIQVDEATAAELDEEGFVKIRFLKNQYESWGEVTPLHNADGKTYVQLAFTNSMITFISDRFLDVELILNEETGLKIPNSSIVNKEFFLVPEAFLTMGGDGKEGVLRQTYLEDGTISSEFVEAAPYSFDEDTKEYYLDNMVLKLGDILLQPESQATFTVSKKATLTGVYNMNKGYADFNEISILSQNEEYAIVQSNTKYGLNVYDYIILDAKAINDDQFLYE